MSAQEFMQIYLGLYIVSDIDRYLAILSHVPLVKNQYDWYDFKHINDRNLGPAKLTFYKKNYGGDIEKRWIIHGLLHRINAPALIIMYYNGTIKMESWWSNGWTHRTDGPAMKIYNPNGMIGEQWFIEGKRIR
jgi:hypothetical protein